MNTAINTAMNTAMHTLPPRSRQSGVALVIGLVMLIALTLIGLTSARMTITEEKMSSNLRDTHLAFEAAEAALVEAERVIQETVTSLSAFDDNGSDGYYNNAEENIWRQVDWEGKDATNTNKANIYSAFDSTYNIKTSPKYVIQHYATIEPEKDNVNLDNYGQGGNIARIEMFRITARGTGGSDNAVVVLQTTYGKKL